MCATFRTSEPARVRTVGRGGKQGVCAAVALASAILLGGSVQVLAGGGGGPNPPDPAEDHVWAGCELDSDTAAAIAGAIEDGTGGSPTVSFVIVYSLENDNDGQAFGDGSTGPVICVNPVEVNITAFEADPDEEDEVPPPRLTEQSDIPTDTDPNFEDGNTVDVLETEEAFIIKYQHRFPDDPEVDEEPLLGAIEKRICHTVDENVDCFIISPVIDF